jgi:hypothetical protein
VEERLPEGWEPVVRARMGFTIAEFARDAVRVEFGVEKDTKRRE